MQENLSGRDHREASLKSIMKRSISTRYQFELSMKGITVMHHGEVPVRLDGAVPAFGSYEVAEQFSNGDRSDQLATAPGVGVDCAT